MSRSKLSQAKLKTLRPGRYCDGDGLWVYVKPNRRAYWVFRYRLAGVNREMGLGPVRDVTHDEAREAVRKFRNTKREGLDPIQERHKERAKALHTITFREAAAQKIEAMRPDWKNAKHAAQWESTLKEYAFPVIGDLNVNVITEQDIENIMLPIWHKKHETARRVLQRVRAVLAYATVLHYREGINPATWEGHLKEVFAKKERDENNFPSLPYQDMPKFWVKLSELNALAAQALKFTILCATRSGETLGAKWDEISGNVWLIPASRMKKNQPHRVPLSTQARAVLENLPESDSPFVFPGQRPDHSLSNMSMAAVLKRMKRTDVTVHGMRSTFRTWAEEQTSAPWLICEQALAHKLKDKTERAYNRSDLLIKREKLMQQWGDFCTTPRAPADVLPIRKVKAK